MRPLYTLITLLSLTLGASLLAQHDHGHFPSNVLQKEFSDFVEEMIKESHPKREDVRKLTQGAIDHYKYAFMVTAPQEKKLEKGTGFTTQKNFNILLKRYSTLDLPMPIIGQRLIELNNQHKLDDVQLEMAYRIILFLHDERVTEQIRQ